MWIFIINIANTNYYLKSVSSSLSTDFYNGTYKKIILLK